MWKLQEFLFTNWISIFAVLGPIASYAVGKGSRITNAKMADNTVRSGELLNVQDALGIYRGMLDDLKTKLDEVNKAYQVLEDKLSQAVQKEIQYQEKEKAYLKKIESLGKENKDLIAQVRLCDILCDNKSSLYESK